MAGACEGFRSPHKLDACLPCPRAGTGYALALVLPNIYFEQISGEGLGRTGEFSRSLAPTVRQTDRSFWIFKFISFHDVSYVEFDEFSQLSIPFECVGKTTSTTTYVII